MLPKSYNYQNNQVYQPFQNNEVNQIPQNKQAYQPSQNNQVYQFSQNLQVYLPFQNNQSYLNNQPSQTYQVNQTYRQLQSDEVPGPNFENPDPCLLEVAKSVCKIRIDTNNGTYISGTGFFLKFLIN